MRIAVLLLIAGCRWRFDTTGDDLPTADGGFVVDDAGQFVHCDVDTDCGRCQRCENSFCQRATFADVDLGQYNGCALDERGQVWCWGLNDYQAVAPELTGGVVVPRPRRRTDITATIDRIALGWGVMYLRTTSHELMSRGSLDGDVDDTRTFWDGLSASHFNGCATTTTGELYCSGLDDDGQLGRGTLTTAPRPLGLFGTDTDWARSSTFNATCAIKTNGTLWCVGRNDFAQLGRGTTTPRETDIAQLGTANDWSEIALDEHTTCGIRGGQLWCWGLEFGTNATQPSPLQVGTATGWSTLDAYYRCAVAMLGGTPYWACSDALALATSLQAPTTFGWTEMPVTPDPGTRIVLGATAGCFRQNGQWMCWGDNRNGAVGVDDLSVVAPTPLCE
ncbi:MAG TPA: hypothetical protein VMZ53_22110 [Kofleriaceae bacterium]|nr:hypothetical protein [Kofleriaceae bacterium]